MTNSVAIDRDRAASFRERLDTLDVGPRGRVACLVETPRPHEHVVQESVRLIPGRGCAGDHDRKSFYKGRYVPGREVSAITKEVLDVLGVDPVVVGDNLITTGIDLAVLRPGDRVCIGDVVLERSRRRHLPCTVFRDRTSPEAFAALDGDRHRGALFVVRTAGTIHRDDRIEPVDAA